MNIELVSCMTADVYRSLHVVGMVTLLGQIGHTLLTIPRHMNKLEPFFLLIITEPYQDLSPSHFTLSSLIIHLVKSISVDNQTIHTS